MAPYSEKADTSHARSVGRYERIRTYDDRLGDKIGSGVKNAREPLQKKIRLNRRSKKNTSAQQSAWRHTAKRLTRRMHATLAVIRIKKAKQFFRLRAYLPLS